jgi:transcriptional regulator
MYKLPYFTEDDPAKVIAFMKENLFAVVTGTGEQYPVASHLPLEIIEKENGRLAFAGHLMKNTDHHKAFLANNKVLVIFNGPHTHVSASWYVNPNVASTWNYMTVHAKGKIGFNDEAATYDAVKRLTERYEPADSPAAFDKLPEAYVSRLIPAIVAFEIEVESLENVFKLSQNHDRETRKSIAAHLQQKEGEGAQRIAKEIIDRLDHP